MKAFGTPVAPSTQTARGAFHSRKNSLFSPSNQKREGKQTLHGRIFSSPHTRRKVFSSFSSPTKLPYGRVWSERERRENRFRVIIEERWRRRRWSDVDWGSAGSHFAWTVDVYSEERFLAQSKARLSFLFVVSASISCCIVELYRFSSFQLVKVRRFRCELSDFTHYRKIEIVNIWSSDFSPPSDHIFTEHRHQLRKTFPFSLLPSRIDSLRWPFSTSSLVRRTSQPCLLTESFSILLRSNLINWPNTWTENWRKNAMSGLVHPNIFLQLRGTFVAESSLSNESCAGAVQSFRVCFDDFLSRSCLASY